MIDVSLAHDLSEQEPRLHSQVIRMMLYQQGAFVMHVCMTWTNLAITDAPGVYVCYWSCACTSHTHKMLHLSTLPLVPH